MDVADQDLIDVRAALDRLGIRNAVEGGETSIQRLGGLTLHERRLVALREHDQQRAEEPDQDGAPVRGAGPGPLLLGVE